MFWERLCLPISAGNFSAVLPGGEQPFVSASSAFPALQMLPFTTCSHIPAAETVLGVATSPGKGDFSWEVQRGSCAMTRVSWAF